MSEVDGLSKAAGTEEMVELEPTQAYPAIEPARSERSFHMAIVPGSVPSVTGENEVLLRNRLRAAAVFLAVVYGLFFVIRLAGFQSR